MLKKFWNNKRRNTNGIQIIDDIKEENEFLYELLTDDNLESYDARQKILRMKLITILQNIKYEKQRELQNIELCEEINYIIKLEEESKKEIENFNAEKNESSKKELFEIKKELNILESRKKDMRKKLLHLIKLYVIKSQRLLS